MKARLRPGTLRREGPEPTGCLSPSLQQGERRSSFHPELCCRGWLRGSWPGGPALSRNACALCPLRLVFYFSFASPSASETRSPRRPGPSLPHDTQPRWGAGPLGRWVPGPGLLRWLRKGDAPGKTLGPTCMGLTRGQPRVPSAHRAPPFPGRGTNARSPQDVAAWGQPRSPWRTVCSVPKGFLEGFPGPPSPRAMNPGHTASSPGQRLTHAVLTQLGALGWAQLCTGQQADWCSRETGPHP